MTAKQLLHKLQEEKFDVEHFDVTVNIGDETATVTGVELDAENKEVRLSLDTDE